MISRDLIGASERLKILGAQKARLGTIPTPGISLPVCHSSEILHPTALPAGVLDWEVEECLNPACWHSSSHFAGRECVLPE